MFFHFRPIPVKEKSDPMDHRIKRAIVYLNENLARDLSVEEMARMVRLSGSRFAHLFAAETGTSPAQYLKRLRLKRAGELLRSEDMKISEVMKAVGVKDPSHFLRDFKRAYGRGPRAYRSHNGASE